MDSLIHELKKNPEVELVERNTIFRVDSAPNDPFYTNQWALATINAEKAWQKATGKGIRIGIVDTGIDYTHVELKNQLWINPKEDINHDGIFEPWASTEIRSGVTGDLNGIDDDSNGFVDDVIGYDFVDQTVGNVGDYSNPDPDPNE